MKNEHLVFLPGLDGTGLSFDPVLPLLAADTEYTIVSYPADKMLSFAGTVDCAADQFPAGVKPVVIAESFSGPVAIQLVASGRVQAKCLILCATFARSPHPFLFKISHLLGITSLLKPEIPPHLFRFFVGGKYAESLAPLWRRVHAGVSADIMNYRLRIINQVDVRQLLTKILIPCLYLQAAGDRIVPASSLADFRKYIPQIEVKKIKGPHFLLQAQPETCLTAVDEFLKRHT